MFSQATILDTLDEGIYMVNRKGVILFWNAAAGNITGYSRDEMVGSNCSGGCLEHMDLEGNLLCRNACPLQQALHNGTSTLLRAYLRHKQGNRVPTVLKVKPVYHGEEIAGAMEIFSADKRASAAYGDATVPSGRADQIPGVEGQTRALAALEEKLGDFGQKGGHYGVLLMELNCFPSCIKVFGGEVGGMLQSHVAKLLRENVREGDFVGRWEQGEYLGIFQMGDAGDLGFVAGKLRSIAENIPLQLRGRDVPVRMSVGGAVFAYGDTPQALMARAQQQLNDSRLSGKICIQ